ncbi:putative cyclophilin [Tetragenococcus muriaticus PMC-11-5]|uniref:Putative cyclophilin n=1 Tax=Tetragenococcus muriaticus PMC-11-5 TaxID=1302649 RepID=A0A091C430_9ENTE|nr:cyclophilin-like fold protein [Tetragenococcus muriaticus]KFN92606.1 putative cyclophilin [Tetragenococcus muriaticus PMC-11-5]
MKTIVFLSVFFLVGCTNEAANDNGSSNSTGGSETSSEEVIDSEGENSTMEVFMTINDESYPVTLNDSEAAQNFVDMMPLTLTLSDYADTEKVSDLPSELELGNSDRGHQPSPGDITIYEPWGNLAIFYNAFDYSDDLIHLGHIEDGADMLESNEEEFDVTFTVDE